MNSSEAQFILEACRSGDLNPADPQIAEALSLLESDPELARWFAEAQEFDRAVAARLKTVPVPPNLLQRIRAGKAASLVSPAWPKRQWLALAALIVLLGLLTALLIPRGSAPDFASFRDDMAEFMDEKWDHTFDLSESDFLKIKNWLELKSEPVKVEVPLALAASRTFGCKTFQWGAARATLICFLPEKAGSVVHVLVVERAALTSSPGEQPQFARLSNWNSAIWSRGNKTYLALTTAKPDKLAECL